MNAYLLNLQEMAVHERSRDEVVRPREITYYVYLVNGAVREVGPATGVRLTDADVVFVLGELVVTRIPSQDVHFVAPQPTAPPVLF